jgi:alkylation response protein AidB-like acyl-CoA dehydrogenase
MDLSLGPEHEEFRRRVRAWLKANAPKRDDDDRLSEYRSPERVRRLKEWQRKLYDAGYVAMGWPKEYGGQAADVMRQTIVNQELVLARAPQQIGMMGVQMVGPTLIQFGSEEQKRRYLPRILNAEEIWCQGYSEPGAGSDLASLKTKAELVGDEFIVNGQKVWTSNAQIADWMFCLVRTDPEAPKHCGIPYPLIDTKSPGITARPLARMTGDAREGFSHCGARARIRRRRRIAGEGAAVECENPASSEMHGEASPLPESIEESSKR